MLGLECRCHFDTIAPRGLSGQHQRLHAILLQDRQITAHPVLRDRAAFQPSQKGDPLAPHVDQMLRGQLPAVLIIGCHKGEAILTLKRPKDLKGGCRRLLQDCCGLFCTAINGRDDES